MNEIVRVTPKIAAEWLNKNTSNRRLDMHRARALAEHMRQGRFYLNGDTIRFAKDGSLIDGQHRLQAVILANLPVELEVRRGLDAFVMPTIDVGVARSMSDVLRIMGHTNTAKLAPSINWANFFASADSAMALNTLHRFKSLTALDQLDFINQHPFIIDAVLQGSKWYEKFRQLTPTLMMGQYYHAHSIDPEAAMDFFSGLASGANMDENDPRMALRRRLILRAGSLRKEALPNIAVIHIYAWNAWRDGRTLKRLIYTPGDTVPRMQ